MAKLLKIHTETVNHQFECYEKRYELAEAASAGPIAATAQASMRRALKTDSIIAAPDCEAHHVIVLQLPLTMERKTIERLQARLADFIEKSPLA